MHERVTCRGCLLWGDGSAATAAAAVWRLLCNTTAKAEASAGTLWKKRRERRASSSCIRPAASTLGPLPAMMVEVMAAALVGSSFGFEASGLFSGEGDPPDLGQTIIAIDPGLSSNGAYSERIAALEVRCDCEVS